MLDRFQNLPTAARVALSLVFVVLVIGLVALLAKFSSTTNINGTSPSPEPTYTSGASAAPTPSTSASPDVNNLGPNNLAPTVSPSDLYGKDRKYSDSQLSAATIVARNITTTYCRLSPKQTNTQWVDSLRPFYTADDFPYSESDYPALISQQSCTILNAKPQQQTADGMLLIGVAASQTRVYQEGAPIVPNSSSGDAPYYYTLGGTVTMKLVDEKWYVDSYDVDQN